MTVCHPKTICSRPTNVWKLRSNWNQGSEELRLLEDDRETGRRVRTNFGHPTISDLGYPLLILDPLPRSGQSMMKGVLGVRPVGMNIHPNFQQFTTSNSLYFLNKKFYRWVGTKDFKMGLKDKHNMIWGKNDDRIFTFIRALRTVKLLNWEITLT